MYMLYAFHYRHYVNQQVCCSCGGLRSTQCCRWRRDNYISHNALRHVISHVVGSRVLDFPPLSVTACYSPLHNLQRKSCSIRTKAKSKLSVLDTHLLCTSMTNHIKTSHTKLLVIWTLLLFRAYLFTLVLGCRGPWSAPVYTPLLM